VAKCSRMADVGKRNLMNAADLVWHEERRGRSNEELLRVAKLMEGVVKLLFPAAKFRLEIVESHLESKDFDMESLVILERLLDDISTRPG
jgi:hypothetical protein